jgi:hypothetical protein
MGACIDFSIDHIICLTDGFFQFHSCFDLTKVLISIKITYCFTSLKYINTLFLSFGGP